MDKYKDLADQGPINPSDSPRVPSKYWPRIGEVCVDCPLLPEGASPDKCRLTVLASTLHNPLGHSTLELSGAITSGRKYSEIVFDTQKDSLDPTKDAIIMSVMAASAIAGCSAPDSSGGCGTGYEKREPGEFKGSAPSYIWADMPQTGPKKSSRGRSKNNKLTKRK